MKAPDLASAHASKYCSRKSGANSRVLIVAFALLCHSIFGGRTIASAVFSRVAPVDPAQAPPAPALAAPSSLYSIGNPTDEEQLFLELVNRARMNPAAEGLLLKAATDPQIVRYYDFFQVDLDVFATAMAAIPPAQPVAMNGQLTLAARVHSVDMFNNTYQEHVSIIDGTDPRDRAIAQGYPGDAFLIAENIYAQAQSVLHGHAGFEVDWGNDATSLNGMQNPPHHRETIHDPRLREVGMGVVLGSKDALPGEDRQVVGPVIITQDFGVIQNAAKNPFITGVAYYDLNGNGAYDLGEGLGGVTVTVDGIATGAVTADAGGYAVPVPANHSYNLTFTASGIGSLPLTVNVDTNNVKIDFTPAYRAPILSGPNPSLTLRSNSFQYNAVGSAVSYQARQWLRMNTGIEGAENGLTQITATVAPDSPPIVSDAKAIGGHSFHMMHTGTPAGENIAEIGSDSL